MRKLMVAAIMLAAVSLSVNAAKKDKKEVSEPVLGIKSGVITMANNMGQFQGMGGWLTIWASSRAWAVAPVSAAASSAAVSVLRVLLRAVVAARAVSVR